MKMLAQWMPRPLWYAVVPLVGLIAWAAFFAQESVAEYRRWQQRPRLRLVR